MRLTHVVISEQKGHTPLEWNLRFLRNKTLICVMKWGMDFWLNHQSVHAQTHHTHAHAHTCTHRRTRAHTHTHYKASFLLLSYFTTCEESEAPNDAWEILGQSLFRRACDKEAWLGKLHQGRTSESTAEWISLYNPAPILMPGARRSLTKRLRGPTIVSTRQRIQGTSFFTRGPAQLVFPLSSGIRGNLKLRSHEVDISLQW